ncbi:glucosaminidase domain-containing protein, partial [Compostibacillus humi]|uniref:glucosaminidase domain-containing protein n=1 Tax=Compostibacillus humi TaxID=1245525 RepID=UPI001662AC09
SDYGNWWRVIFSDRVGYVRKSDVQIGFTKSDKYFRADSNVAVYDNRGGGPLKKVGELVKGQVYPRVSDYGNWHRIDFGNFYGYVKKSETSPASGSAIKNENKKYKDQSRTFTALKDVTVYDNTSGKLVPFGKIDKGQRFPIAADYGKWWIILYSDRVGYIKKEEVKVQVKSTDKYFRVFNNLPVYDNRTGSLKKVGELVKGQSYPIHSDYGNWWRVKFGNIYGYVRKSDTGYATKSEIPNLNSVYRNLDRSIISDNKVTVYDNSSGKLVPFGTIEKEQVFPIASDYGNWWRIIYLDRIGYVRKSEVQLSGFRINYSKYNITLEDAAKKQMKVSPQTDVYMNGDLYVRWDAFISLNGTKSGVIDKGWRIRTGPGTNFKTAYMTTSPREVKLIGYARDSKGAKWWKITRDSLPSYLGHWVDAKYEEVLYNMDPDNFIYDDTQIYQFLDLRHYTGIPLSELRELLKNKGKLDGTEQYFRDAAKAARINELYLISHALLETGNGKSVLAMGVPVDKDGKVTRDSNGNIAKTSKTYKVVYNMYGIGAYDKCAIDCGAERAFKEKWFTVKDAIIGGAQFAKNNYIYSGQNTIYKMRWNPAALVTGSPTHQYATDVGWARKQVSYYARFYSSGKYNLIFDIPVYK